MDFWMFKKRPAHWTLYKPAKFAIIFTFFKYFFLINHVKELKNKILTNLNHQIIVVLACFLIFFALFN